MGSWGAGLFQNDDAEDLREDFRGLIADGLSASEATARLVEELGIGNGGVDDHDFWLALASVQHTTGHVDPLVQRRARAILDDPAELDRWDSRDRRRRAAVLDKLRKQLAEEPPAPKRLRRPRRLDTALEPGQYVVHDTGTQKVLLRIVRVHEDDGGRYPAGLLLDWDGSEGALSDPDTIPYLVRSIDEGPEPHVVMLFGSPNDPPGLRLLPTRSREPFIDSPAMVGDGWKGIDAYLTMPGLTSNSAQH